MRFVMVRHGQSENNLRVIEQGYGAPRVDDPSLTALGHVQAQAVAEALARRPDDTRVTHVFTSLMTRAVETGHHVADALGLPLVGVEDLAEIGGPQVHLPSGGRRTGVGRPRAELEGLSRHLRVPPAVDEHGWWRHGDEHDDEAIRDRAVAVLQQVRGVCRQDDVACLVTHEALGQRLLCSMLGIDAISGWFNFFNGAVMECYDEGGAFEGTVSVACTNDTRHLAASELSE